MIKKTTLILFLFVQAIIYSQVGIGTITPDSNAVLDIYSTNKGFLITRVVLTATNSATPLSAHVAGMIVYNTVSAGAGNTAVFPGFYYNDGSQWIRLEPLTKTIGDLKYSLATADHLGWYLLDGRAKASLPALAQTNATSIGFGVNIPNAADKILKAKSGAESLMAVGGSNTISLAQANLPNLALAGTANTNGDHNHNYNDQYHATSLNLNIVSSLLGLLSSIGLILFNNDVGAPNTTTTNTAVSTANGLHSHTVSVPTGGSGTPIPMANHLVTNVFVYLGN